MKKFFKILMKILLVVVLVISIGIAVFLFILSKNQNAPQKYWEKIYLIVIDNGKMGVLYCR